jgi:hypothetical protein
MVKHPNKKGSKSKDKSFKDKVPGASYSSTKKSKPANKFSPLDPKGSAAQVPYAKVKEALINDILKEGGTGASDVATSLEQEKVLVMAKPALEVSKATDDAVKAIENRQLEIEYKEDLHQYMLPTQEQ